MTPGDENYKRLRAELDRRLRSDRRLSALAEKIEAGTADFADTAEYTQIVARHIGEVMSENIGEITDPVGKELAARALLRDEYESINGVLGEVQAHIDEGLGIQLEPVKPAFPAERVAQAAHSLLDPTVTEQTIRRRARSTSENITNSFHDDFIEENARFRSRAGLKVYVERRTSGKCCPWCTEVAGRYLMSEQPEGLFRRHDNCDCVIIYDGKVLRGQRGENGRRTRTWEDTGERAARIEYAESKKPARLSREEAERLQGEHMPEGLTGGAEGGIIDVEEALTKIGFERVDPSFIKNVNKDFQVSITDQLATLENRFHAISNSNKPVISADLKGGSTACVRSELNNPENQKLILSSRQFKNRKRHIEDRRKDVESFFCMPCNTDDETLSRYVVTHEYGHMLENSIAAQDMKGTINTFPRLTERYREQIEKIARTIDSGYDKNKSKYLSRYVRESTPYGHKNEEFFAECFANSQLGQPNVLGQAMLQWLEKRGFNVF